MNVSTEQLRDWTEDARARTFSMVDDLDDDQMEVPYLPTVNPFLWELGHGIWFQEYWVLRHALGGASLIDDPDHLFDSAYVGHEMRWHMKLPDRAEVMRYGALVRDAVLEKLTGDEPSPEVRYFVLLSVFHEDMHQEAFCYMRQTLGYPQPSWLGAPPPSAVHPAADGDVVIPGGRVEIGASRDEPFVFDNEKWAHAIDLEPFAIARTAVTQAQFAEFVEDGGYRRPELWSDRGWRWRQASGAESPVYWRRADDTWQRRVFDSWHDLEPDLAVSHVNWYEADAWCQWARRRLPTEAEWEVAATAEVASGAFTGSRSGYPWGDAPEPSLERANLDGSGGGPWPVAAAAAGDTPHGCRQMLGNVWEWTASDFLPYPGFVVDPYKQYSKPWFGCRKVLRGGCWMTRTRMLRPTWRNYFTPNRRDVFAGFRTCAMAH
jgi:iron(II)-dependent oxidoreductase